jgi:hypothetical protein
LFPKLASQGIMLITKLIFFFFLELELEGPKMSGSKTFSSFLAAASSFLKMASDSSVACSFDS